MICFQEDVISADNKGTGTENAKICRKDREVLEKLYITSQEIVT